MKPPPQTNKNLEYRLEYKNLTAEHVPKTLHIHITFW